MELDLTELERNRLRLWRRWDITFDWFNYPPPLQRVHQAMLIHRQPWTTRALANYTNLPQTSVRRQLEQLKMGRSVELGPDGFELTNLAWGYAVNFHKELVLYVRGGRTLDKHLLHLLKMGPNNEHMNFDMLEHHVWWPIIDMPENFER